MSMPSPRSASKLALLCGAALLAGTGTGKAVPSSYSTSFTEFAPGSVIGQNGWVAPSNSPTVGTIVPANGGQALQLSETTSSDLFGVANGLNGPRIAPAGEPGTSTADGVAATSSTFTASLSFRTPSAFNPPDPNNSVYLIAFNPASSTSSSVADRYAFFGLRNNQDGTYSFVISPIEDEPDIVVLSNVQPNTTYSIDESLTFVPGTNPDGSGNDVFTVSVAGGGQSGSGTGTDWEGVDGYRDPTFAGVQGPLAVDTLDILGRYGPAGANEGELLSVSYSSATTTGVPEPASLALLVAGLAVAGVRRRPS